MVGGQPLLLHTLASLAQEPRIALVQPVIGPGDTQFEAVVRTASFPFALAAPVTGGAERANSMQLGLAALPEGIDLVAVHDAARPLPSAALLKDVLDVAIRHGAAVPGLPVNDTIKRVDDAGRVVETPDRSRLVAVQTPQVARRAWFEAALQKEAHRLHSHTDDASMLEAAGYPVYISRGEAVNRKITTQEDLAWLQQQLEGANR